MSGHLPKNGPVDIHQFMSFRMPKEQVQKLTLMWLGLVAFNVLLSTSSVEEIFKDSASLTAQSEVCGGKYYTHKTDKEGSVLFAFLGSAPSLQSDSKNKDLNFSASDFNLFTFAVNSFFEVEKDLIKTKRFLNSFPRAPPLA